MAQMIKKQKNSPQPLPTNLPPNIVQSYKRSISQKQEELNLIDVRQSKPIIKEVNAQQDKRRNSKHFRHNSEPKNFDQIGLNV